jgi:glutamine phosphoribosylpyrophosphate amidotransferase
VGISVYNDEVKPFTSMGLMSEFKIFLNNITAPLGIGHERYSTAGRSTLSNAQPIAVRSKHGVDYAFAFNGNFRNLSKLKSELREGSTQPTESDTRLASYDSSVHACKVFDCPRHGHCMFEWVYFARMDSVIEGIPVSKVREDLGRELAEKSGVDADMVVPVPDSGRSAAMGYARASGVPLREVFQVDRYRYRRIFIMPDQAVRERKASKKLNVPPSNAKGKRVVVVDDSIVRGTNMRNMDINKLKRVGVKAIHVRINCPPLMDRCPYGVDFHRGELIVSKYQGLSHEELCQRVGKELGATSLYYNTLEDLEASIGLAGNELCMGCLTGTYPAVDWSQNITVW